MYININIYKPYIYIQWWGIHESWIYQIRTRGEEQKRVTFLFLCSVSICFEKI